MKPTADKVSQHAARILAVTPRAPRTAVDSVLAEIAILIADLCETDQQAELLTRHLVDYPQPRWNFAALKIQAQRFMAALTAPPPPKSPPLQLYGFEYPEWAWTPPGDGRAHSMREAEDAITGELWRRILSWPPARREQLEKDVRAVLTEYQRGNPSGPFANPNAELIKHYMIVFAGKENERAHAGKPEPCPIKGPKN